MLVRCLFFVKDNGVILIKFRSVFILIFLLFTLLGDLLFTCSSGAILQVFLPKNEGSFY